MSLLELFLAYWLFAPALVIGFGALANCVLTATEWWRP
jgi:hypothetical protein